MTSPIRLHIELADGWLNSEQQTILKKYGQSSTGTSLTRDILIPADMPLHALHYVIQKLYGWQNSHLRCFKLPDDVYQKVTHGTFAGWLALSGVLFYGFGTPEDDQEFFWDDDYDEETSGYFKVWLRKKYTGPYSICGDFEDPHTINTMNNQAYQYIHSPIRVPAPFAWEKDSEEKLPRIAKLIDLKLDEACRVIDQNLPALLERLEVASVLADKGTELSGELRKGSLQPITHQLIYEYDYGDNWHVLIERQKDCDDLLRAGLIKEEQLREAEETVEARHKPVCLYSDGYPVMDDVGGLSGFTSFLQTINESKDAEERKNLREWAASMGWSTRKTEAKRML